MTKGSQRPGMGGRPWHQQITDAGIKRENDRGGVAIPSGSEIKFIVRDGVHISEKPRIRFIPNLPGEIGIRCFHIVCFAIAPIMGSERVVECIYRRHRIVPASTHTAGPSRASVIPVSGDGDTARPDRPIHRHVKYPS
jgi:hypothetical protein